MKRTVFQILRERIKEYLLRSNLLLFNPKALSLQLVDTFISFMLQNTFTGNRPPQRLANSKRIVGHFYIMHRSWSSKSLNRGINYFTEKNLPHLLLLQATEVDCTATFLTLQLIQKRHPWLLWRKNRSVPQYALPNAASPTRLAVVVVCSCHPLTA